MTASREDSAPRRSIGDVREVVAGFLKTMPGVREVNVTRVGEPEGQKGGWEAEADVLVPNATIKNLGLELAREVLDTRTYLVRLDEQLHVVGYGPRTSVGEAE